MGDIPKHLRKTFSMNQTYEDYPYKNKKDALYMSAKTHKTVLTKLFKRMSEALITTGKKIQLPAHMGYVIIYKHKTRKKLVNHNLTMKLHGKGSDKRVYINTNKTNNFIPKVIWSEGRLRNSRFVRFNLIRSTMRYNSYCKEQPPVLLYEFFNEKGYLLYDTYVPARVAGKKTLALSGLSEKERLIDDWTLKKPEQESQESIKGEDNAGIKDS